MATHEEKDQVLREHLIELLEGGSAHDDFDSIVSGLSAKVRGETPEGVPYSPWQLLEHIRLAQWDIVNFCIDEDHVSPDWPEGFWPQEETPPSDKAWNDSVSQIASDLEKMKALVLDRENDLYEEFPHGDGQTLLREAILVADHMAYHLGQMVVLRRLLGAWEE